VRCAAQRRSFNQKTSWLSIVAALLARALGSSSNCVLLVLMSLLGWFPRVQVSGCLAAGGNPSPDRLPLVPQPQGLPH